MTCRETTTNQHRLAQCHFSRSLYWTAVPSVFRDYHFIAANLCSGPTALIGSAPAGFPLCSQPRAGSSVVEKRRHHSESAEQLADSPHCSILRIPRAVNSVKPGSYLVCFARHEAAYHGHRQAGFAQK